MEFEEMFEEIDGVFVKKRELFMKVPIEFICNSKLTDSELRLYLYFLTYSVTEKRGAYPSKVTIAKDLGWSKSKVLRTVKSLQDKNGILKITRIIKGTKRNTSNLYYLSEIVDGEFDKEILEVVKKRYPNNTDINAITY